MSSVFYAFLLKYKSAEDITLWLDNCGTQNKNWTLWTMLVDIVNSNEINAQTITIKYFEPGMYC